MKHKLKHKKRRLCIRPGCICFIFLWILLFLPANRLLMVKRSDGTLPALDLRYQKKNTTDVLFLGPSRIGLGISSDTLWEEYGIAGYVLWGSAQPLWNSYYLLIEALKTQSPKAVVLETSAAGYQYEYQDEERQIVNTSALLPGINRWNAVKASGPVSRWIPLFLGFPLYHTRYAELTQEDYLHFFWNEDAVNRKGSAAAYGILEGADQPSDQNPVQNTDTDINPNQRMPAHIRTKEAFYLRKIIEECSRKQIQLMLVSMPVPDTDIEKPYYEAVSSIADEYGVPYYNFNEMWEQTGLEMTDFYDTMHLNAYGARKFSKVFGSLLKETYGLTDRRGSEDYDSWEQNAVIHKNEYIHRAISVEKYFTELEDSDRIVLAAGYGNWEPSDRLSYILENLELLGLDTSGIEKGVEVHSILSADESGNQDDVQDEAADQVMDAEIAGIEVSIRRDMQGMGILINGQKKYTFPSAGIAVIVYDTNTKQCIDGSTFLRADGWEKIIHWNP